MRVHDAAYLAKKATYAREYRKTHRDEIKAARRARYNPIKNSVRCKAWRAANPGYHRTKCAAWRDANPEKERANTAAWHKDNPEKVKVHHHRRRARKLLAEGTHTAADTAAIRASQKNRCAMPWCHAKLGRHGHLDHIIPLSRGGSNWPRNLQWLCASCNLSKGAKDAIDFARENGLLL